MSLTKKTLTCSSCGFQVAEAHFQAHAKACLQNLKHRQVSKKRRRQYGQTANQAGLKSVVFDCPYCQWLNPDWSNKLNQRKLLMSHVNLRHPKSLEVLLPTLVEAGNLPFGQPSTFDGKSGAQSTSSNGGKLTHKYTKCQQCQARLRMDREDKHNRKVHGIIASRTDTKDQVKQKQERPASSPKNKGAGVESENKLEGSTGFWRYRENGKFGSYALHDDYGEESEV